MVLAAVLGLALACSKASDAPAGYSINRDASNNIIPQEIREAFVEIPAGTATLGYSGSSSSIAGTTDSNVHAKSFDTFQIMKSEITVLMYTVFLNSPLPDGSTETSRGVHFRTAMQNDLFAGIYRTDPKGGLIVSETANITTTGNSNSTVGLGGIFGKAFVDPFTVSKAELAGRLAPKFAAATSGTSGGSGGTGGDTGGAVVYNVVSGREHYPVVFVDKSDAAAFASWLGPQYRLPTEDEWEYCAIGGISGADFPTSPARVPSGNTVAQFQTTFHTLANFQGAYAQPLFSTPVKSYFSNAFGLYDMAGNVYEWTLATPSEASGTASYLKGGSWNTRKLQDLAVWARVGPFTATNAASDLGFRLVFFRQNFTTVSGFSTN